MLRPLTYPTRRLVAACVLPFGFLVLPLATAYPQVQQCTNGAPTLARTDPAEIRAAFDRLLWRNAYEEYVHWQTSRTALVAFDSIAARGTALIAAVRAHHPGVLAEFTEAVQARMLAARASVASGLRPDSIFLRDGAVADASGLVVGTSNRPGRFTIGPDLDVDSTAESRPLAMVLCAVAGTTALYLQYLDGSALDALAKRYADASHHWDLFLASGYSMTLVERLAASCRLGVLSRVISPVSDCARREGRSLEPPSAQVLFMHPTAGLAPIFRGDTTLREVLVVEGYGYLRHRYGASSIRTFGLSAAAVMPSVGRVRYGGLLHSPWLTAGVFWGTDVSPLYVGSADVIGWVPGVRSAMRGLRSAAAEAAAGAVAARTGR